MKLRISAMVRNRIGGAHLLACAATGIAFVNSGRMLAQEAAPTKPPAHTASASQPSTNAAGRSDQGSNTEANGIKVRVNYVEVPVVVRDLSGHTVGDLQKENFEIFDNRKQQQISQFRVERIEEDSGSDNSGAPDLRKFVAPARFTAMLFDDVHLTSDTLPQLREASLHRITAGVAPSERVAIFTTSGKLTVDFTDDRAKLTDALRRLKANPVPGSGFRECPNISYGQANLILNRLDRGAKGEAVAEAMQQCGIKDPKMAAEMVMSISERVLALGNESTNLVLKAVLAVIERLSTVPGQRNIFVLSPGFLVSDFEHAEYQVTDIAVRNHVVINTLDARGVLTDADEAEEGDPLAALAYATGGTLYHNNNNLDEGVRRLSERPKVSYVLAFSPSDLNYDGAFHKLSVKIQGREKTTINSRQGYFAPKQTTDSVQAENDDISKSVFSRETTRGLPIEMRTQFVKEDRPVAKLSVLAMVDLNELPHGQKNGQNTNELRIVAVVFDRNGKYMGAIDKKVNLKWLEKDARMHTAGKYDFILDSGGYLVRLVVRDSQSQQLFTQTETVEIP